MVVKILTKINIMGILFGILILVAIILIGGYFAARSEAKYFNNGVCLDCKTRLRHFDCDSQGGRGYTCDECGYTTWVSYPTVDKDF